ncbi:N-6 DNA methylase [bacterium]|nr:MAG: N-6 DNA methylase [bacterium]
MKKSIDHVRQLVNDFKKHEATYLAPDYQEQEARKDFIDKFLIALGWDVNHEHQKNPYEQEVKIEQSVRTGKSQRRADYAFFVGPNFRDPKFFVEAKKPSRSLANPDDYYQIIRYAYNKKIPISVLTDFEEFHVIDCRFMPDINTALDRRMEHFHYSEYADEEKFSRIFHLFGRDGVAAGSIEKRASELPKPKKGKQQVSFKGIALPIDEAFLVKLDDIRLTLAKSFKKHNQDLGSEELTEAVQRTIDRLVFIRFLEDKNIEEAHIANLTLSPSPLKGEKRGEVGAWRSFVALCKSLEPKYNGLVFKHHSLIDGDKFIPPEEEFAEICNELADPSSPYLFDEIPISILGSIYERFLGKVVHATPKRADVEDKPEVRKAGGVYYTPEYIVRYIVQNTVGKLLQPPSGSLHPPLAPPLTRGENEGGGKFGKTPEEISKMAFADIACGSGSFLIEVYSELLDYHTRYYSAYPEKAKPGDTQMREGKVVLSLKKRQEILINNIYGVDIDYQATEVTQLSLYLKLLEDVTMNDAYQFSLIKEKILPDLKQNIVCGNSLIGTDILEGDLFEKTEERKLNPMNFEDAFPKVMKRGGFDAIVGNPPYGFHQIHIEFEKPYFRKNYESSQGSFEHYFLFYEKSLGLLDSHGLHGFIVPVTWLTIPSAKSLRKFVLEGFAIREINWLPELVFKNAQVNTLVSIIEREKYGSVVVNIYDTLGFSLPPKISRKFKQSRFIDADFTLNIFEGDSDTIILKKIIEVSQPLSEISRPCSGYNPYEVGKGLDINGKVQTSLTVKTKPYHSGKKLGLQWKPEIVGRDLQRYHVNVSGKRWIKYGPWLAAARDPNNFIGKRILVQEITGGADRRIIAAFFDGELYHSRDVIPIKIQNELPHPFYILAIISSRLITWFHHKRNPKAQKALFPKVLVSDLGNIPIYKIDKSNPADKSRHDHIVKLVEQMLGAKEKLSEAKLESEKDRLELLCTSLDRQIDEAAYELYGLTEEEIKVVEG